jgi:hypothetical protein
MDPLALSIITGVITFSRRIRPISERPSKARQHDVHHGRIVRLGQRQVQPGCSVRGMIHGKTFRLEPFFTKEAIFSSSSINKSRIAVPCFIANFQVTTVSGLSLHHL